MPARLNAPEPFTVATLILVRSEPAYAIDTAREEGTKLRGR